MDSLGPIVTTNGLFGVKWKIPLENPLLGKIPLEKSYFRENSTGKILFGENSTTIMEARNKNTYFCSFREHS
jgi:hypothetical protein